jgi:hypothetical protein
MGMLRKVSRRDSGTLPHTYNGTTTFPIPNGCGTDEKQHGTFQYGGCPCCKYWYMDNGEMAEWG